MPIHGTLFTDHMENPTQDPFALQNKKMLKVNMAYGQVWARTGSMVAYQGDVRFENTGSGGMDKLIKSTLTGEGVDMMSCTGQGELFLADLATEIQVFYLENDTVSVNGANVLAFSGSIEWDIHRVQARGGMMAGGLFNVALRGTGLRRRHHQRRAGRLRRRERPDLRRRRGRGAVDGRGADGPQGRLRRR